MISMLKSQRRAFRWPNNLFARLYIQEHIIVQDKATLDILIKLLSSAVPLEK